MDNEKRFGSEKGLPPDLWPRKVREYPDNQRGSEGLGLFQGSGNAIYVGRSFSGYTVLVNTTPTLIIPAGFSRLYLLLNPSTSTGLTTSTTGYAASAMASGNSQASPISVGGYEFVHAFLHVSAISGTWDFGAQVYDPLAATWANSQTLFSAVTATGNYYAYLGSLGVATDLAFFWTNIVAGAVTFQIDITLKSGIGGGTSGLSKVIYLGPNEGVSTVSGYPLLEGQQQQFIMGENVPLWGIGSVPITIRVFVLN